jgi:hypothetical protein
MQSKGHGEWQVRHAPESRSGKGTGQKKYRIPTQRGFYCPCSGGNSAAEDSRRPGRANGPDICGLEKREDRCPVARTMANVGQVLLKGLELTDAKKQLSRIEELARERYYRRDKSQETGQEDHVS